MDKKVLALIGAVLLGSTMTAQAITFNIDDFSDVQVAQWDPHTAPGAPPAVPLGTDTNGPLSPLSGSPFDDRVLSTTVTSNPDLGSAEIVSGTGVLSISKGPNMLATYYAEYTSATGVDFTALGINDNLAFEVAENNAPNADLLFTVTDGAGNTATLNVLNIPFIATGSPTLFQYDFTAFVQDVGNSADADFTDVQYFRVDVNAADSGNGVDLQLSFFATTSDVPVPAPLGLLGLGLVGLVISRRKALK